jgi:hypothetical protein
MKQEFLQEFFVGIGKNTSSMLFHKIIRVPGNRSTPPPSLPRQTQTDFNELGTKNAIFIETRQLQ